MEPRFGERDEKDPRTVVESEKKERQKVTVRKKIVLRLDLDFHDYMKARSAVALFEGVDSIAIDEKRKEMTVVGVVDVIAIVSNLRKFCHAELIWVSPAEEKGNEKEKREESKAEPKKEMAAELKKGKAEKKDELSTRFEDEAEAGESEKALSAPSISRCLDILDALADMVGSYNLQHGQLSDLLDILRQLVSESFDAKQLIEEIILESGTAEKQSILTDSDSLQLNVKKVCSGP